MKLKYGICLSTLFLSTITSYANPVLDKVPCPSLERIQQTAPQLDKVQINGHGIFIVYTANPAFREHNITWFVAADMIAANAESEALRLGKDVIQHASFVMNEDAIHKSDDSYYCYYGPGAISATGFRVDFRK